MAIPKSKEMVKHDHAGSQVADYLPGAEEWDNIVSSADTLAGHDLAKDDLLDALQGVPFLITRVVFRQGYKNKADGKQMAYVSCETVIAPEHVLKRRRVNMEALPFEPGSQVIFNDGSTGIYRQVVAYLAATGRIELDESKPESGSYGESRYDCPPVEFLDITDGDVSYSAEGWADYAVNVRLTCPRGLRLSHYENDYSPDGATTRYLA